MPVTYRIIGTGLTKRIVTTIHLEGPLGEEELAAFERMAEEYNSNTFENYLTSWRDFCQNLLAKAQLPPWRKTVYVDMDGNWTEVMSTCALQGLGPGRITTTRSLAEEKHGIDSEPWFACEILAAIDRVQKAIADHDPVKAVDVGIELGNITTVAVFKFTWEPAALIGKKVQQGVRRGGKRRGQERQQAARARHAQWQQAAEEMWDTNPALPKAVVSRGVARKFNARENTVRKHIHKAPAR